MVGESTFGETVGGSSKVVGESSKVVGRSKYEENGRVVKMKVVEGGKKVLGSEKRVGVKLKGYKGQNFRR